MMLRNAFILVFLVTSSKSYNIRNGAKNESKLNESYDVRNSTSNERSSSKLSGEVQTCGGIFSKLQFIIETPNYPSNYPNNLNCLFIFKGPYCESNYTLQFLDFNLENSLGCVSDRLEIKDKDAICGIKSGIKTYTADTGTLILNFISNGVNSARGFRILVSRSICRTEITTINPTTTTTIANTIIPATESTTNGVSVYSYTPYPSAGFHPNTKEPACCASTYNTRRFYIASPGFPSMTNPSNCQFTIFRANPKICRIRVHFKFFWVGVPDTACTQGYLQIDGKLICGCHTGMKLVSPFDGSFGNTKVFRFKSEAIPKREGFAGFVIEIIQDECPKRYARQTQILNSEKRLNPLNVSEKYEIADFGFKPKVIKHVYFFDAPYDLDDDVNPSEFNRRRDVEETSYLDTFDLKPQCTNGYDIEKCSEWGISNWNLLNSDPLWAKMTRCNEIAHSIGGSQCKEFTFVKGYFQSPGYPYYYPKNSNICYRFLKQRGYCKIRLIILDFQLEHSIDCRKDYLKLNGNYRYCGQSLANTFTLFDMSGKHYEEIRFITDSQNNGRGFRGIYEQIPCYNSGYQPNPHWTLPPPTTTTEKPCSRQIMDPYFTIDIYDYGKDVCKFVIQRSSEKICQLDLSLISFDFQCESEFLLINNQKYCGNLAGRTLSLEFVEGSIEILYNKVSSQAQTGLKLHLSGQQIEGCDIIPPAQRLLLFDNATNEGGFKKVEVVDEVNVILRKDLKDVCGVVMNLKSSNTSESFCNYILNKSEVLECNAITPRTIYVPYHGTEKLELKFRNAATVENIEFKEITCDNKFIL